MRLDHGRLQRRGWSKEEIARAEAGIRRASRKRQPEQRFVQRLGFGILLGLTLAASLATGILILPAIIILGPLLSGMLLALLGLCFGALFSLVMADSDWLERSHHGVAVLLLVLFAAVNTALIANSLRGAVPEGALLAPGIAYGTALLIPYLFHLGYERAR